MKSVESRKITQGTETMMRMTIQNQMRRYNFSLMMFWDRMHRPFESWWSQSENNNFKPVFRMVICFNRGWQFFWFAGQPLKQTILEVTFFHRICLVIIKKLLRKRNPEFCPPLCYNIALTVFCLQSFDKQIWKTIRGQCRVKFVMQKVSVAYYQNIAIISTMLSRPFWKLIIFKDRL